MTLRHERSIEGELRQDLRLPRGRASQAARSRVVVALILSALILPWGCRTAAIF